MKQLLRQCFFAGRHKPHIHSPRARGTFSPPDRQTDSQQKTDSKTVSKTDTDNLGIEAVCFGFKSKFPWSTNVSREKGTELNCKDQAILQTRMQPPLQCKQILWHLLRRIFGTNLDFRKHPLHFFCFFSSFSALNLSFFLFSRFLGSSYNSTHNFGHPG